MSTLLNQCTLNGGTKEPINLEATVFDATGGWELLLIDG